VSQSVSYIDGSWICA